MCAIFHMLHVPYKHNVVFQHRQLNGEDLQGLTLQELQKIEEHLKRGLSNVSKQKVCAQ